jgi:hypothetical protein
VVGQRRPSRCEHRRGSRSLRAADHSRLSRSIPGMPVRPFIGILLAPSGAAACPLLLKTEVERGPRRSMVTGNNKAMRQHTQPIPRCTPAGCLMPDIDGASVALCGPRSAYHENRANGSSPPRQGLSRSNSAWRCGASRATGSRRGTPCQLSDTPCPFQCGPARRYGIARVACHHHRIAGPAQPGQYRHGHGVSLSLHAVPQSAP